MPCSAYVSYQVREDGGGALPGVLIKSERLPSSNANRKPVSKHTATSFVLVDPSKPGANGGGKDARSSIRKHASKACAAQRLATIAEKKKSLNQLSKREQKRQQAAERLENALQNHARKFAPVKEEAADFEPELSGFVSIEEDLRGYGRRTSDSSDTTLSSDTLTSLPDTRQKKCSIPWLLGPTPTPTSGEEVAEAEPHAATKPPPAQQITKYRSRPGSFDIISNLKDQIRYTAFEFPIDDRVCFLMHLLTNCAFELMELRLPTKADIRLGRQHPWRTIMPQLLLNCEPLFWTTMLGAGTLDCLRKGEDVAKDRDNDKYRDWAITCINRRFRVPENELVFDCGLISAVASIGTWERQCGSKEVWREHCKGVDVLLERLKEAKEDQLVAQIIAQCRDDVPNFCTDDHSPGFQRIRTEGVDLDESLVSSVCACPRLASIHPYEQRLELLESTAIDILKHTTLGTISKRIRFPNRINLEMHILLQGAGVSMINFMAGSSAIVNVDQIDLLETCREAVYMATSIFSDSTYDEVLLWALFTTHALNDNTEPVALRMISRLVQRLNVPNWLILEDLLRSFAYLDSAAAACRRLWSVIQNDLALSADDEARATAFR